jgi:hypothetical protein
MYTCNGSIKHDYMYVLILAVGDWVAVMYDENWWPGVVEQIEGEVTPKYWIKFMKPCPTRYFFAWPGRSEKDCLARHDILTIIHEPPMPVSRRYYCFSDNVYQCVQQVFESL